MDTLNLGGLAPQQFLQQYWQKKPLLIRAAGADLSHSLSAEELAGLACEDNVESRLVLERSGQQPWEVRHGPFTEADFASLPESHWTLLVQDVDKHLPQLGAPLVNAFRFIPDWRVDDLMISFAADGGSVGPHVDAYDVFLLQAHGRRRWAIGGPAEGPWIEDIELRILSDFRPDQEWILEPGDMLYLPPGVAHHGVALGDSMTYSIGFRAPSDYDLIQAYLEWVLEHGDQHSRYSDADLQPCRQPGRLDERTLERMRARLSASLQQPRNDVHRWLGGLFNRVQAKSRA